MRIPVLLIALASLFLIFGCLDTLNNYHKAYAKDDFYTQVGSSMLDTNSECRSGACACFVCDASSKSILGGITSLQGKTCYVDPSCTSQDYYETNLDVLNRLIDDDPSNNKPEHSIRNFMIGAPMQGFSKANNLCYNSLTMATQWLIAPEGGEYASPDQGRTSCYLGINTLPVYLLFSKNMEQDFLQSNAVLASSEKIAETLKDAGPAIISTEANITYNDFKKEEVRTRIKEQLAVLRGKCPRVRTVSGFDNSDPQQSIYNAEPTSENKCLVGAFIPFQKATPENIQRVADFMRDIPVDERPDMIIYGISSKDSILFESDMAPCLIKPSSALFNNAVALSTAYAQLSGFIDKDVQPAPPENNFPSLIAYMHFEPFDYQIDRSRLNLPEYSCSFDEGKIVEAYSSFWNVVPQFPSAGILGVAPYASDPLFNGPFESVQDSSIMLSTARKDAWYGGCQAQNVYAADYITKDRQSQKIVGLTSVYASAPGVTCDLSQDFSSLFNKKPVNGKFGTSQRIEAVQPGGLPVSCDACLTDNSDIIPFNLDDGNLPPPPEGLCGSGGDLASIYSAFDSYSSDHELDPLLTRAITWRESVGAGEQVVGPNGQEERVFSAESACKYSIIPDARVCNLLGIDNLPGNVPNAQDAGALAGQAKPELLFSDAKTHNPVCQDNEQPSVRNANEKFCAYGLMQVIDYPDYILDKMDPNWRTQAKYKFVTTCSGPDHYFDPFDPDDNICLGTLKFKMAMDAQSQNAKDIVTAYFEAKGINSGSENYAAVYQIHVNFMKAYLADIGYSGSYFSSIPGGPRNMPGTSENIKNHFVTKVKEMIEFCTPTIGGDLPQDCDGEYSPSQEQITNCEAADIQEDFLGSIDRCFVDPNRNDNSPSGRIGLLRRYAGLMNTEACKTNVACPPAITSRLNDECVANAHNYPDCGPGGRGCFDVLSLPDGGSFNRCNFEKYETAKIKAAVKARQAAPE